MWNGKTLLRNYFSILILVLVMVPGLASAQAVDDVLILIESGDLDSARTMLSELNFANPGHPGIRYATALLQTDALVAAGIYKDIVRNHSASKYYAGSLMRLGEYYYAQGLYVQSRQHFMRLILFHEDSPHIVRAVNLSLRAGIASRQLDSVHIDLSKIIRLYPDEKFDIPEEIDLTRLPGRLSQTSDATPTAVAPLRTLGQPIANDNEIKRGEYTLQAGAFGNYDNARRLADQIESIGYSTRIKERRSSGRTLYLILVGDYSQRTQAMSAADLLEAALGVESFPVAND